MISLTDWAARWGVPDAALRELAAVPGLETVDTPDSSEGAAQALVRLAAARAGIHAWRNNVGAGYVAHNMGVPANSYMRWGLANDSKQLNAKLKSSDLVGIKSHLITSDEVGKLIGQLWCREIKRPGWKYTGTDREVAQLRWITLINANGGDAAFSTGGI